MTIGFDGRWNVNMKAFADCESLGVFRTASVLFVFDFDVL